MTEKAIQPRPKAVLLLTFLLAWSMFGCVSLAPTKTADLEAVRTVVIAHKVAMPEKMVFYGLSQSMLAGLAGGVGGGGAYAMEMQRSGATGASEHYDLPQSLRASFAQEFGKTGKFKVVSAGKADAEMRIKVTEYGFYQAGVMVRRVRPILIVETELVRPNGTVVFKKVSATNHMNAKTPAILPEKIRNDRKVGVDALQVAARVVATDTAAPLR